VPGWDETSVDELLADPIVRDVMAVDGVAPSELRALLYSVQRTIESYATRHGGPTSLAGFVKLCSALPAKRTGPDVRKSRMARADYSTLSPAPLRSPFGQTRCNARS